MINTISTLKYLRVPTKSSFQYVNLTSHSFLQSLPLPRSNRLPILYQKLKKPTHSTKPSSMADSSTTHDGDEVTHDLSPVLKVYKSGRIERLAGVQVVPPGLHPETCVESKDVVISEQDGVSARLFIPQTVYPPPQKLPLVVYTHGGIFCIETPFSPNYHNLLNKVVAKANVVAVSVHFRRPPEHPVPTGHHDSWLALKWVASHVDGNGPEEWLNSHADFGKVFLAGDSSGANIASYLGIRVGTEGLPGVNVEGVVLVQPFFWGEERFAGEENKSEQAKKIDDLLRLSCSTDSGSDDPIINPDKDPNLGKLACGRLLVCVSEKDLMRDRGLHYKQLLEKNGWCGAAEVVESKDEDHAFYLFKPNSENTNVLLNQIASFMKQD